MKTCGACGNPRKGKARKIYVRDGKGRLVRRLACSTCFDECVHLLIAPPLQLAKADR